MDGKPVLHESSVTLREPDSALKHSHCRPGLVRRLRFPLVDVVGRQDGLGLRPKNRLVPQVWSLTQFYSVEFSKSRIDVKKCVFNKRTIKVCVICC